MPGTPRLFQSKAASDDHHLFLSRLQRGPGSGVEIVVKKDLRIPRITEASPQSVRHTFPMRPLKQGTPLSELQGGSWVTTIEQQKAATRDWWESS